VATSCSSPAIRRPGIVSVSYLAWAGAIAGLYYGSAKLGYAIGFSGPIAAIVWLPAGIGIAAVFLGGMRFLPAVLAGDLLANDYMQLPLGSAFGQTVGNLLEVIVAVVLLRRLVPGGSPLGSARALARTLLALAAGTLVSASVGAVSLLLGGVLTTSAIPNVSRTWWLGDFAGALIVVPLAIAWYRPLERDWPRRRALEGILVFAGIAALSELAMRSHRPLSYLVFPGLIWAALRFGQRGATLAILIASGFTVWNTTHYQGPFAFESITRSVLSTQLFIIVAAVSTLYLVALVSEREDFAKRLSASRSQLLEASDLERRRLERNLHDGAQQRLLALAVHLRLAAEHTEEISEPARAVFVEAEADVQLVIGELRDLAHGFHPAVLTNLGLADAIRSVVASSDAPVTLDELPATRLDEAAEATGYYVIAEAVANARKYAHAAAIHVRAGVVDHTLHVEVEDDGVGGAAVNRGSGLAGLRDRVEDVGGTFDVTSGEGRGTRVAAAIPAQPR
jgi:signal transduction histidine kinase